MVRCSTWRLELPIALIDAHPAGFADGSSLIERIRLKLPLIDLNLKGPHGLVVWFLQPLDRLRGVLFAAHRFGHAGDNIGTGIRDGPAKRSIFTFSAHRFTRGPRLKSHAHLHPITRSAEGGIQNEREKTYAEQADDETNAVQRGVSTKKLPISRNFLYRNSINWSGECGFRSLSARRKTFRVSSITASGCR